MTGEQYRAEQEAIAKATSSILEAVDGLSVRLAKEALQESLHRITCVCEEAPVSQTICLEKMPFYIL